MTFSQFSKIFTVSELNKEVRLLLEKKIGRVWINGEISNFMQPASGHWYFTLKDKTSQIRCAMFRNNNQKITFRPKHGWQVLVNSIITLYESRGDFQTIVESMKLEGEGLLQQKYEQLKLKLLSEGIFDKKFKKLLPPYPNCIGIITSKTGAALQDILQVLKRRAPTLPVIIYPTSVQGDTASTQISRAIEIANIRQECDVLIIGRGGGSLEDLLSFNNERVARSIFNSKIPIISAVGHETDITISDFVSDLRAPTPSAAAEIVSQNQKELLSRIIYIKQRLKAAINRFLSYKNYEITQLIYNLKQQHPKLYLSKKYVFLEKLYQKIQLILNDKIKHAILYQQRNIKRLNQQNPQQKIWCMQTNIQKLKYQLIKNMKKKLNNARENFSNIVTHLEAISPLSTLIRGYSITFSSDGKLLKQTKTIQKKDIIFTHFLDGYIESEVKNVKLNNNFLLQKKPINYQFNN